MATLTPLTPADWARAALTAMSIGGTAAIAVEPLARALGTSKGSFYWHFRNREALLAAALELWEREHTEDVITAVEVEADPRKRLRLLLLTALSMAGEDVVDAAVLAGVEHPLVAAALDRVTRRRTEYLAAIFGALGFTPAQARDRGLLAYTAYLGQSQLIGAGTAAVPADGATLHRYVDRILVLLTAPV